MKTRSVIQWGAVVGVTVVVSIAVRSFIQPTVAAAVPIAITVDQLVAAGFTGITPQHAVGSSFLAPNAYFHVKETLTGPHAAQWGSTSNLVAVLVKQMDGEWSPKMKSGEIETIDFTGRTHVRLNSDHYYISVTGPDKAKVTALARSLRSQYE